MRHRFTLPVEMRIRQSQLIQTLILFPGRPKHQLQQNSVKPLSAVIQPAGVQPEVIRSLETKCHQTHPQIMKAQPASLLMAPPYNYDEARF